MEPEKPEQNDKERRRAIREKAAHKAFLQQKSEFERTNFKDQKIEPSIVIAQLNAGNAEETPAAASAPSTLSDAKTAGTGKTADENLTAAEKAFTAARKIIDGGQMMLGATITGGTARAQRQKVEKQKEEEMKRTAELAIENQKIEQANNKRNKKNAVARATRASIDTQNPIAATDVLQQSGGSQNRFTTQEVARDMKLNPPSNTNVNGNANANKKATASAIPFLRSKIDKKTNKVKFWTEEQWYEERRDKILRLSVLMICTFVIILAMGGMALISWRTNGHWYSPPPGHGHVL